MKTKKTIALPALILVTVLCGCGPPAAPPQHAPPDDAQDDESTDAQAGSDIPAPAFTASYPFTDIEPKCQKYFSQLSTASLPVITSQEELDKLLGCKTTMVVDWSSAYIVPVAFDGINRSWSFKDLSTQDGVTTITVLTDTMNRGAAIHSEAFWLVRVPQSTKSAVIQMTSAPQNLNAPLYP